MSKELPLLNGGVAIVDDQDYDRLSIYNWYRTSDGRARATIAPRLYRLLHHLVIGAPPAGLVVDHCNGDPLDNRRTNLRFCTQTQNQWNRGKRRMGSSLRFKGIQKDRGVRKWRACIKVSGRRYNLGWWNNEEDAAHAYDAAARFYFGPFARTNFAEGECLLAEVIHARSDTAFITGRCCYRRPNGRWVAQLDINQKTTYLGTFATEAEA
ncbi:MAG: HNH endonuclease [Bacillota bacterium]